MHALKKIMLLPILVATAAFSNAKEAPMSEPPDPRPKPLSQANEAPPAGIETRTGDAPVAPRHTAIAYYRLRLRMSDLPTNSD